MTEKPKTSGIIDGPKGYRFLWITNHYGDEISGLVKNADGQTIEGSHGWYRTSDPEAAARRAFTRFVE